FLGPREPLERDAIEVQPFEGGRRQRLRTEVGLVRGTQLIPGVQRSRERTDGVDVSRPRHRGGVRARQGVARLRRKRVEGEPPEGRKGCLRGGNDRRADTEESNGQKLNLAPSRICRSG